MGKEGRYHGVFVCCIDCRACHVLFSSMIEREMKKKREQASFFFPSPGCF